MSKAQQVLHYSSNQESPARHLRAETMPRMILLDPTYADEICRLEQLCYPSPWSDQLIQAEFTKEVSWRWGLSIDEQVVAYCFCYLVPEDLHILNLAVVPECRSLGYSKYLLANLLSRAVLRGVRNVFLEVRANNQIAQKLYARFGFRPIGARRAYYRDNGEDAIILELQLSANDTKTLEKLSRTALKEVPCQSV